MGYYENATKDKDLVIKGNWWVPGSRKKVKGTATVSVHGGCELRLDGHLRRGVKIPLLAEFDVVYGESWNGPVTLFECIETYWDARESRLESNMVITGSHMRNTERATFDRVAVDFTHLDEWLNRGLFDLREKGMVTWRSDGMKRVFKIGDDMKISFVSRVEEPSWKAIQTSVELREKGVMELQWKKPVGINDILELVNRIRMFLSLGTQRPEYIERMTALSRNRKERVKGHTFPREHDIYVRQMEREKTERPRSFREMLFAYVDIEDSLENVLNGLVTRYDTVRPLFLSHIARFYLPKVYIQQHFLSLVIGLEQFHRLTDKRKPLERKEWAQIKREIKIAVGKQRWEWLAQKVGFANELTLKERLVNLLDKNNAVLVGLYGEKKYFTTKVGDTRNFLVHGSERLRNKSAGGIEMGYLAGRLEVVVEACALVYLGVEPSRVRKLFTAGNKRKYSPAAAVSPVAEGG